MQNQLRYRLNSGASLSAMAASLLFMTPLAMAQDNQDNIETITVTGYRASLESALNIKRTSTEMVDAINAEDVAKMPDANLAESLQRLPGVSITRDNGEGRQIVVRGLGSDFTRVTINGMEALSTVSGSAAQDTPNRTRRFDFNTFASELFSQLKVQKTPSASTDEGSLGATVGLSTGKPLDMGDRFVASVNNAVYERGAAFNPRIVGLASHRFFDGKVGALVSVAYNMRRQALDYYTNGSGGFVYNVGGNSSGAFAGTPGTATYLNRAGFAAPTGTSCTGNDGAIPGVAVTNSAYCAALSGSDAAAYSAINTPRGYLTTTHTVGGAAVWDSQAPSNELGAPALAHQSLYQTRIGLTGALQWQVDDQTMISLDALFSSYYQNSASQLVTNLGLNRNNTNAVLNTANSASSMSTFYGTCTVFAESAIRAANGCGSTPNGWTHNLLPFQYFTLPTSVGYRAADPNGMLQAIARIGKPSTKLIEGHATGGVVDYLKTTNNDIRTTTDANRATTQFSQVTLAATHDFSSKLHWDGMIGASASRMRSEGVFVSMEALDKGTYIYDIRGDGMKPVETGFGFDVSDPAQWDLVKFYSAIRHFSYINDHKYTNISTNLNLQLRPEFGLRFGFQQRVYQMNYSRFFRVVSDGFNPSLAEMGVAADKVMKVVPFDGKALGMGGTTPTAFAVPDLTKLDSAIGFLCKCENEYGDWRNSWKNSTGSSNNVTQTFGVSERDRSFYLEATLEDVDIGIGTLRGNIGARFATTDIHSTGWTLNGFQATADNSYNDLLPSFNLVYSPTEDMMIRFGMSKVMSRPDLSSMAPTITAVTISNSVTPTGGSLSAGNPYLKPFRASAIDLSYEWYFGQGSLISVAGFAKFLKTNPQSQTASVHLSDVLTPSMIGAIRSNLTDPNQIANLNNNSLFYNYTTTLDAPGGTLRGIEINFQQQMYFLPDPFDGFGINANYTLISSKIHYLFRTVGSANLTDHIGPWFGASPTSINATLYYSASNWEARLSGAYRTKFVDAWPVRSGTVAPGFGNSPAVTDYVYGKSSLYVDASASYDISDNLSVKMDALNLLDQHSIKYTMFNNATERETYDSVSGRQFFVGVTYKY